MRSRAFGQLSTLLALTAALVSTTACGPSGQGSSNGSGVAKIVVGQISAGTSQTPLFIAVNQGFFSKAGLDVSVQSLSGGTASAMASFATGSVNMLVAGSPEFIEYAGKKVISGKIIGELTDQNYDIVVSKGIANLQGLKGKIVGISGYNGADQVYLEAVMAKNSMSPEDVTFIVNGSAANRLTALSTGTIQAIAVSNANRDVSAQVGSILLKSGDSRIQLPSSMIFASGDLITKQPAELKKFVQALGAATQWMRANPGPAAAICAKGTGATVEACKNAIAINLDPNVSSHYTWSATNAINTQGVQSALGVMAALVPETAWLTVGDVVDTSIAGATP